MFALNTERELFLNYSARNVGKMLPMPGMGSRKTYSLVTPMPIFIVCCVVLTTLIETHDALLPLLNNEWVWMSLAVLGLLFLGGGCLQWLPGSIWHDGFACCGLLTWYGYWKPLFSDGSPQFSAFPIYLAVLSSWMWLGFILRSSQFDQESQEVFRYFQQYLARVDACLVAGLVSVALAFPEHYLSYPLAMTFFIVRSAFQRCLESIEQQSRR